MNPYNKLTKYTKSTGEKDCDYYNQQKNKIHVKKAVDIETG